MQDYKNTLFMGKTNFEMRGNLGQKEPLIEEEWTKKEIYQKRLAKNKGSKAYILHDGPPYANGNIHIGHALNKILKDIVVRYKNMQGFYSPYIPGWDTHGLPIEINVSKTVNRKEVSTLEFRKHCHEYAIKQVEKQKIGFKRLGVLASYDDAYLTLQKEFERDQVKVFAKMVEKGLIYKGLKPVYWSPSSESALAEAEIEYHDKEDKSIYFTFPIISDDSELNDAKFLVWTTTPWTLPANLAVCAGPDINYVLAKTNKGKLIFGYDLLNKLKDLLDLGEVEIIKEYKGTSLEGLKYKHPLYDRISPCVLGDYVSTEDGSGLVHIAPGHGEDDYNVGKIYHLDVLCPVDNKGYMTKEAGKYEGLFYTKCNEEVINDLDSSGNLLKVITIVHSYPHDWRTKKPVIFRATPQWFASIDKIKDEILTNIKNVNWYPKWGDIRMTNMIKERHDWCISRQRVWGVPIPIIYCEDGTPILDQEVFKHISNLFGEFGSDIWFMKEAKELLPNGYSNPHSPNNIYTKEKDIMDVWFDSGSSYMTLLRHDLPFPADLYLEGADQYRGWFNSSLITSTAMFNGAPYKNVLTHGFTLDGEGRKMSKSLGNVIDPSDVCKQNGADVLRLWVASIDYQSDMPISKELLKQISETYRKIRNTIKFILANTSDFDPKDSISYNELESIDKYMFIKLNKYLKDVYEAYDTFRFGDVYRLTNTYINNTLSSFYLDFSKDILYILDPSDKKRLSLQTVLYQILISLLKVLTPIIPHTTSEAYNTIPCKQEEDIYLENMTKVSEIIDDKLEKDFDKFMIYRNDILKSLEEARANKIIGKSFNAKLIIYGPKDYLDFLNNLNCNLAQILIVSQLELKEDKDIHYEVNEAKGHVCSRCWMVVEEELKDGLCSRCHDIVFNKNA